MSLSAAFAPLLRALTGGRYPPPDGTGPAAPPGEGWAELAAELGLPPGALREVAAGGPRPHGLYRHFTRPKKGGGRREISEPCPALKRAQRAIIARYFAAEQPHPAAVAYQRNKSIAHHVWAHAGAELFIAADVEGFFPGTAPGRVEDWWRERAPDRLARLLTRLTTYRGGLPQGAPTSPALSNFLNREMDERLEARARAAGARYTRYCDDLLFSWRGGQAPPADFEAAVRGVLHAYGYALHPRKGWRAYHRRDEPTITGAVLTRRGGARLPDDLLRAMRSLSGSDDPRDADRLAGYRGYEAMVRKRPRR